MTYNEYENVHKAKHAEAANHYILCDWTSHNDFYRLKHIKGEMRMAQYIKEIQDPARYR